MIAQEVIKSLRNGTVPQEGTELIAVGIDDELKEVCSQLEIVKNNKSDFKFVIGDYGAGKTFFASSVRKLAYEKDFVVSTVVISSETPLNKFDLVYKKILENLRIPSNKSLPALSLILEEWLLKIEDIICEVHDLDPIDDEEEFLVEMGKRLELELTDLGKMSYNFSNALRAYYKAKTCGDNLVSQTVVAWLKGEKISLSSKKSLNVAINLDIQNAITFMKAINILIKNTGYNGLVIIMDEIETVRNYTKKSTRDKAYENLRYFIDECDKNSFNSCYFLYSGTTELMETDRGFKSLEPLYQRLKVEKNNKFRNLRQPVIFLQKFNSEKLISVSNKVCYIHGEVYNWDSANRVSDNFINNLVKHKTIAFGSEIAISPRSYLRMFVDILDKAQQYENYIPENEFKFNDEVIKQIEETEREQAHIIDF